MVETSIMIGVIMAMSELIKKLEIFSPKFIPLTNLVVGIVFSVLFDTSDIKMALFNGIVMGLTASGLYSGSKNIYQELKGGEADGDN